MTDSDEAKGLRWSGWSVACESGSPYMPQFTELPLLQKNKHLPQISYDAIMSGDKQKMISKRPSCDVGNGSAETVLEASELRCILDVHRDLIVALLDDRMTKQEELMRRVLHEPGAPTCKEEDVLGNMTCFDASPRTDESLDSPKTSGPMPERSTHTGMIGAHSHSGRHTHGGDKFRHWLQQSVRNHRATMKHRKSVRCLAVDPSSGFSHMYGTVYGKLLAMVDHYAFDFVFGAFIVLNSVFIGVQITNTTSTLDRKEPTSFFVLSCFFSAVFAFELLMRLLAEGLALFRCDHPNLWWNIFDGILVFASGLGLVTSIIELQGDSLNKTDLMKTANGMRLVRILRIVRLIKLLRMVRILRFVHSLRLFVISILGTLMSLFWAMVLLLLLFYFFGGMFALRVGEYFIDAVETGQETPFDDDLRKYWGSIPRAMFTLYKCITGGIDWELPQHALHVLGGEWVFAFLAYLTFTVLAVLNVVTGVFCQNAIETASQNQEELVHNQLENRKLLVRQMEDLFSRIDEDDSGHITLDELEKHLNDESVQALFEELDIEYSDAANLFHLLSTHATKEINAEEFVVGLMHVKGSAKRADILDIQMTLRDIKLDLQRLLPSRRHF